jgi:tripartite-type tricarboxylate transporter receptor subunit TctC
MSTYRFLIGPALVAILGCQPIAAQTDNYPSTAIRLITPVPPGGSVDTMARVVADKLGQKFRRSVIVENRPGGSNTLGIEAVLSAPPDGYTLLFGPGSTIIIMKLLYPNRPLNPDNLEPISRIATNPTVLVVNPNVPAKTLPEFIAYAKANPGKLNYATAGEGGVPHLTAEMFQMKAAIKMTKVPYRGVSLAMNDLLAGNVDLIFVDISTAIGHIRSGGLRVLGVAAKKRNSVLSDTLALTEMYPDLVSETWFGMLAPPKTPAAIVNRLSTAVAEIVKQPDVLKRMQDMGNIEPIGSTPIEMAAYMRSEKERWAAVIQEIGLKGD